MADSGTFKNLLHSAEEPLVIMNRPPEISVLKSVKLHWKLAMTVAMLTFVVGAAVLFRIYKSNYTAHAVIYVSPEYPHILGSDQAMPRFNDSYVDDQVQMLKQTDILADALRRLPVGLWQGKGESTESAAERLSQALKIKRIQSSSQIQLDFADANPNTASAVLNAVTTAYVARSHKEEFYGSDDHLKALYTERDHLTTDLEAQIDEKTALLNKLGLATVSTAEANPYDVKLGKLQLDLLDAEQKRSQSEAHLNTAERVDDTTQSAALDAEAEEVALQDSGLTSYKTSLNARRSTLLSAMSGLTAQNPVYKQDAAELKQIDASLSEMTHTLKVRAAARLEDKLRAQAMRDRLVEGKIRGQVAEATSLANSAAPRMEQVNATSNSITRLEGRLSLVDERIANLELQSSSPGSVHLSQVAVPPPHADPSKAKKLAILLLPVCLFLGIFAAVVRDLTEPYVWNGADVNHLLGFEPVAVLPMHHLVADGFYREQLFRLAGGMERAIQGSDVQTVLMAPVRSSLNTGEILEQIAREMSHLGLRIVVVDSQQGERALAYPAIHETGENSRQKPVELALAPTNKGRLGTVLDATTEFEEDADAVLLEGAPLLLSADSEYLARMVDATVLVAVAGETKRSDLLRAVRLLERIRAGSVAVVVAESDLNHADPAYRTDAKAYVNSPVWPMPSFGPPSPPAAGEYVGSKARTSHPEPVAGYVRTEAQTPRPSETYRQESSPTYTRRPVEPEARVLLDHRGMLDRRSQPDRRVRQISVLFDRRRLQTDRRDQSLQRVERGDPQRERPAMEGRVQEARAYPERTGWPERSTKGRDPEAAWPPFQPQIPEDSSVLETRWMKPTEATDESKFPQAEEISEPWFPSDFPPREDLWARSRREPQRTYTEKYSSEVVQKNTPQVSRDLSPRESAPPRISQSPQPVYREPEPLPANRPAPDYAREAHVEATRETSRPVYEARIVQTTPKKIEEEDSDRGKLLSWLVDDAELRHKSDTQYGKTSRGLPLIGSRKPPATKI
jgi:capsular polysaccharide biosynthesis protein